MNNIICIAGPTASGKTALAVELAKHLDGEVVSCDSMQVYSPVVIPHEPYDSFAAPLDKKELDKPPVKAYIDENDPQLTDNERTILSLFQAQPLHTDSLVARSKLPAQTVLSTLTILQIKRKVEKLSGNYYQRL